MGIFILFFLLSGLCLVVGGIYPKSLVFMTRKQLSRGKIFLIFSGTLITSFVAFAITAPPVEKQSDTPVVNSSATSTNQIVESEEGSHIAIVSTSSVEGDTSSKVDTPAESYNSSNENRNNGDEGTTIPVPTTESPKKELEIKKIENKVDLYVVSRVVDGDTFDVNINGTVKRVRLIGVDTPETVDPRKPVQCFGKEASQKASELLLNKKVKLESDSTQGETDKYGRLLRYAFREDGLFYNKWIIENGYAHEYTYNLPYKYQQEFKTAEQTARSNKVGLWADNACKTAPTATQTPPTTSQPKQNTQPTPATQPQQGCTVKGNINTKGEKLYHLPSCPSYSRTIIEEGRGERWFCSEQEAIKAGWIKAGNC